MSEGTRRLAAIMFTDIVGYTALGQTDEAMAMKTLERQRNLLRPVFSKHGGREVKTIGDAFLVEFGSALEAVLCAIDVQGTVHSSNLESGGELQIRIGVHLGDVIHQGGDVLGDAVNVASRIEPLADPGGVCISRQVQDHIKNKISYPLVKLESQKLKNVAEPVDVYRVVMPWTKTLQIQHEQAPKSVLDATRIAVLPLTNLSPDPDDEFFADGMTEEIISAISKLKSTEVISRTSVMQYKKTLKPLKEVSRELEAGTILEGSFRKAGNRIRITVQMIDATRDRHVWAQNYDRTLDDIFAVQTEIAEKVAGELKVQLLQSEKQTLEKKTPENAEAYSCFLQGRELLREGSEPSLRRALDLFNKAIGIDPSYARSHVGIAECHQQLGSGGYETWDVMMASVKTSLERALALDPDLAEAHYVHAFMLFNEDDAAGVEREAKRALELNPSLPDAYQILFELAGLRGDPEEAVRLIETAYRLDPVRPRFIMQVGYAYFYTGREDKALDHWRKTEQLAPTSTYGGMAEYWLSKGDLEKAKEYHAKYEALRPTSPWVKCLKGIISAQAGDREGALLAIRKLEEANIGPVGFNYIGFVHLALGDLDSYFDYMDKALESHALITTDVMYTTLFAKARTDPRHQALVEKIRRQNGIA